MIGSLMSRMGAAEKLSIPQLQQAIQDGTLPAYVGIPLLQQKVQESRQAQMAMTGQGGPRPSIAQQVMAEAQGVEGLRSNLPETYADGGILNFQPEETTDGNDGYAGGGIVAFANRGFVDTEDDDEEDDSSEDYGMNKEEQKLFASMLSQYQTPMSEEEAAGIAGLMTAPEPSTGIRPEATAPSGIEPDNRKSFIDLIRHQESRGRDFDAQGNPLTSKKGAKFAMQVMDATARDPGFGIKPAKDQSAAEYNRVGEELAYALLDKYKDPKLAAMAYNWGTGNVDKWVAGGMKGKVPGETRQYAAAFKKGGEVKRFNGEEDSYVDPYLGIGPEKVLRPIRRPEPPKYTSESPLFWQKLAAGPTSPTADQPQDYPQTISEGEQQLSDYDAEIAKKLADKQAADAAVAAEAGKVNKDLEETKKEDTDITEYRKWLKEYGEGIKKQKEQDKYMALLAAGLGMMGGTSPYAAANIGAGGMHGIQALMAAQKATGADERALMAGQMGLSKATLYDKMRRDALAQKITSDKALAEYRQQQLANAAKANQIRMGTLMTKASKDWEASDEKTRLEKDLSAQKKDWRNDAGLLGKYNLAKKRWINESVGGMMGTDARSADELLQD